MNKEEAKYQVIMEDKVVSSEFWVSLIEAAKLLDSYLMSSYLGGKVLEPEGYVRPITEEEKRKIYKISDEWADMK